MPRLSRRRLLAYAGGAVCSAVGFQATRCLSAEIRSTTRRIDDEFPHDEYLVVTVDVRTPLAPKLQLNVETCDGVEHREKKLHPGERQYRFGPFNHHCILSYDVLLEGCP